MRQQWSQQDSLLECPLDSHLCNQLESRLNSQLGNLLGIHPDNLFRILRDVLVASHRDSLVDNLLGSLLGDQVDNQQVHLQVLHVNQLAIQLRVQLLNPPDSLVVNLFRDPRVCHRNNQQVTLLEHLPDNRLPNLLE